MTQKSVADIDKNLKVQSSIDKEDVVFLDAREDPFQIYGLYDYKNQPQFIRMPKEVAEATSEAVASLNICTAGGRVRFSTDSAYVAIKTEMPYLCLMGHMALAGSAGFDLYVDGELGSTYYKTFFPPSHEGQGYEAVIEFPDRKMRQLTINFPLYSPVDDLYIGLQNSAAVGEGRRYRLEKPVLFYGSSITQGACASRPGICYQGYLSRHLDTDYINLGFSGSAAGEDAIADYMASLDISVFVCDYDHNAPNAEHLAKTHEKLFLKFRENHPEVPVIFVTAPTFVENDLTKTPDYFSYDWSARRDVIYRTYRNAKERGDQNVYFIDGRSLYDGPDRDSCSVDGLHPNDFGFFRMAQTIEPVLRTALVSTLK